MTITKPLLLRVQWSTDVRTLCETEAPTTDGVSQCRTTLQEGESLIRVQVTDPEGAAAIAEINVTVEETLAPTVDILSPTAQGLYYSDELILFSALLQDNEDSPSDLSYAWESSLDGTLPLHLLPKMASLRNICILARITPFMVR